MIRLGKLIALDVLISYKRFSHLSISVPIRVHEDLILRSIVRFLG